MFEIIEKVMVKIRSFWIVLFLKLRYGKKIALGKNNSFRNAVNIWIDRHSSVKAGDCLCLLGPTYLKAIHGGNLEIGKHCFLIEIAA